MNDHRTDQVLMERVQKGGYKTFGMLMSRYQRRLNKLISRFIQDKYRMYDVVQGVVIRAYRASTNFRGEGALYTWSYRIGIDAAKDFLTTSGHQSFVSSETANEEGDVLDLAGQVTDYHTPEAEMMNREVLQTVEVSIAQPPDNMHQAVTFKEMDGLSCEEIARVTGCPTGTVRPRIFRTRKLIARDL